MIWIVRTLLLTGLCLMAAYDVTNNFEVLGSGIGALAFTWTSVALAMTSNNWSFLFMSGMCAMLSGSYNLEAHLSPDVKQRAIRNQVAEITYRLEVNREKLYTIEQINDCFNDIPDPCKSKLMENHNATINDQIELLNVELISLKADQDMGWQEPDQIGLATAYGTAFLVPFSLSFLAGGLRSTFNLKKSKPPLERFKLFLNSFKRKSNRIKTDSNQIQIDLKQIEREKILKQAWIRLYRKNGCEPKVKELFQEVKSEKGLSAYKYTREWYNGLTDDSKPIVEIKKERDLKIIRPTSGGQIL